MFKSFRMGGFECGVVHRGTHNLLDTTQHRGQRQYQHYMKLREHGIVTIRDGLQHSDYWLAERLFNARRAGMEVIWDLNHYDFTHDPLEHAEKIVRACRETGTKSLWICPVNEPMLYPLMCDIGWAQAADMGIAMAEYLRENILHVNVLTTDPIVGRPFDYDATDYMFNHTQVDVIGINYYPHTAAAHLNEVIVQTWERYNLPVMVSETSWHDGFHLDGNKAQWWNRVMHEVDVAKLRGAKVVGVCWYPIIDSPPWDDPNGERWSHGLIKHDLSVDPSLSGVWNE